MALRGPSPVSTIAARTPEKEQWGLAEDDDRSFRGEDEAEPEMKNDRQRRDRRR
jgi:hypothetical protein